MKFAPEKTELTLHQRRITLNHRGWTSKGLEIPAFEGIMIC